MKKDAILIDFEKAINEQLLDKHIREGISSIALTGNFLWVAGDENISIQRLEKLPDGSYGNATSFFLKDYINLPSEEDEADIEGMDVGDNYLWICGSHSYKRKKIRPEKSPEKEIERLTRVTLDPNRNLLARIPLVKEEDGTYVLKKEAPHPEKPGEILRAAKLSHTKRKWSQLTAKLKVDRHLKPFVGLPGKDNGLDIEGLTVQGGKVFLGLRGPVLRGWAIILEIQLEEEEDAGLLKLKEIESTGEYYIKHFIHLNGMGIRELASDGQDLIILAGPTMDLDGTMEVYRWKKGTRHESHQVVEQAAIESLLLLPHTAAHGVNKAEGLALREDGALLIAYDSPDSQRKVGEYAVKVDMLLLR